MKDEKFKHGRSHEALMVFVLSKLLKQLKIDYIKSSICQANDETAATCTALPTIALNL